MPAASDPTGDAEQLPIRFRPLGVRVVALALAVALGLITTVIWFQLPADVQASFTVLQRATVGLIALLGLVILHALTRCRVDADEEGLTVVNGYRTHRYQWGQLIAVALRPGNPWAVLDLSDGTSQSLVGIQGSDGARAQRQVRRLRALIEAHSAAEPGPS